MSRVSSQFRQFAFSQFKRRRLLGQSRGVGLLYTNETCVINEMLFERIFRHIKLEFRFNLGN